MVAPTCGFMLSGPMAITAMACMKKPGTIQAAFIHRLTLAATVLNQL